MPLMPKRWVTDGLSSTFSLTTLALPWNVPATDSIVGFIIRHGAHHSAQKSTSTGWLARNTSDSKLLSVTSFTFSLMVINNSLIRIVLFVSSDSENYAEV